MTIGFIRRSARRYLVPYRSTWVDRTNTFHGAVRIMWTVDQIKVTTQIWGSVALSLQK